MRNTRRMATALFIMALITGLWLWQWWEGRDQNADMPAVPRLAQAIATFTHDAPPVARIDLWRLFGSDAASTALLDPAYSLPRLHQWPREVARQLLSYAQTCQSPPPPMAHLDSEYQKAFTWAAFLCRASSSLPVAFFTTPPYMHPSGHSYVDLAMSLDQASFRDPSWQQAHLPFLHVLEYSKHTPLLAAIPERHLLAQLDRLGLAAMHQHHPAVLGKSHLFFFVPNELNTGGSYHAYTQESWQRFPLALGLRLVPWRHDSNCLSLSGPYCWVDTRPELWQRERVYGLMAGSLLILTIMGLSFILAQGKRRQRRLEAHQKFVLAALTHELRTPATSFGLNLDIMRGDFDRLPVTSQDAFLRLCDESQRLARVIQSSTHYLKAFGPRSHERFRYQTLPSWNDFISDVVGGNDHGLILEPLSPDRSWLTDAYWLRLCLINLLNNAKQHGRPPIIVRCEASSVQLIVRIQDQGRLAASHMDDMIAKATSMNGHGLGLGLSLVRQTIQQMGGRLSLSTHPTCFTISLTEPKV